MAVRSQSARQSLRDFDIRSLFVEELGWDNDKTRPLDVEVGARTYRLTPVAHKRGMVAYAHDAGAGDAIPDYATRLKIEKRALKEGLAYEHIIAYRDGARQVWQWVKREPGKPDRNREHVLNAGGSPDALLRKLDVLAVAIEDEDKVTIAAMAGKAKQAFDVEGVTKKFYDRFKKELEGFRSFIEGIRSVADREWYASLMLNRLMFIYFMQKRGFLDGDRDYLRTRLRRMQERRGHDSFHTFYRYFLLRLFHEGLAQQPGARAADLDELLGNVPYLNGGLFEVHELEQANAGIHIPDKAFEDIFAFFDAYDWTLDQRPPRTNAHRHNGKTELKDEINPDVLGYIFEKYINQKQMGAYYTKEDITEYIGKSTIIPFLFDRARKECTVAFRPDGALWGLLRDDPDRYIYPAVRHGTDLPLPEDIAAGLHDTPRRAGWNRPASSEYALPTETWREHVARRARYEEVRATLAAGAVHDIDDLVTYNLDLRRFAEDAIRTCEGPETLRAFYRAIEGVTVLDPTCGSGAFLFAALNILEPLYDACLDRMQGFVDDLDHARGAAPHPKKFEDFRKVLARIDEHPSRSRDYYIHKSIIVNNLYGVDIMEEAVEICKLRLFLTLVAQLDRPEEIEPLPDIDFNIRAGNTLVGYATYDELQGALGRRLDFDNVVEGIRESAEVADRAFQLFHHMQIEEGMDAEAFAEAKREVRAQLDRLRAQLDHHLAIEYGKDPTDTDAFATWRASHQPFHWFSEFYGIMSGGGFDVIIGNPPYVVYSPSKVHYRINDQSYTTLQTKNLYAFVFERSAVLAKDNTPIGLIVQLTVLSSERLPSLQNLLGARGNIYALPFPRRPESIFDGVEMPVAIVLSSPGSKGYTTARVGRFYTMERATALDTVTLTHHDIRVDNYRIAKLGTPIERDICQKVLENKGLLGALSRSRSGATLYYQEACRYWVKAIRGNPFFRKNGVDISPPHGRTMLFESKDGAAFAACLMNSSLFYWYYSVLSDCEHINDGLIREFHIPSDWRETNWLELSDLLASDLTRYAKRKTISTSQGHTIEYDEIKALHSKPIIDEIDRVLAGHYGFTDEELDFIINYDIKYRMGQGAEAEDEG